MLLFVGFPRGHRTHLPPTSVAGYAGEEEEEGGGGEEEEEEERTEDSKRMVGLQSGLISYGVRRSRRRESVGSRG